MLYDEIDELNVLLLDLAHGHRKERDTLLRYSVDSFYAELHTENLKREKDKNALKKNSNNSTPDDGGE